MAQEAERHATLRRTFERYVAPQVVEQILAQGADPFAEEAGARHDAVALFADLRGFTRISEQRLPYDVVFLLNRYFEAVGNAIDAAGGIANQFTGDGVMALFGVHASAELGTQRGDGYDGASQAGKATFADARWSARAIAIELRDDYAAGARTPRALG